MLAGGRHGAGVPWGGWAGKHTMGMPLGWPWEAVQPSVQKCEKSGAGEVPHVLGCGPAKTQQPYAEFWMVKRSFQALSSTCSTLAENVPPLSKGDFRDVKNGRQYLLR